MKPELHRRNLPFILSRINSYVQSIVQHTFILVSIATIIVGLALPVKGWAQLTIEVNSAGDGSDADGGVNNICDDGTGNCTLRAAIETHNQHAFQNTINTIKFKVPLPGVIVIKPTRPFQNISGQLIIDGLSQQEEISNEPLIEIDGTGAGTGTHGLTFVGDCMIQGLCINSFDGRGILIRATGGVASNNIVQHNFIGTDATGTIDKGNKAGGVLLIASFSATNNLIRSNRIAGNGGPGIEIDGGGGTEFQFAKLNTISDNTIGGTIPNDGEGVLIHNGAQENKVEKNRITGNKKDGVRISGSNTNANKVLENSIGIRDNAALPNGKNGVTIEAGAKNNEIGSALVTTGFSFSNIISGNTENGVFITGEGTDGNLILNNLIGTNSEGIGAIPNQKNGVLIQDKARSTEVGREGNNEGNVISGNKEDGVHITGEGTDNNMVGNTLIGTSPSGNAAVPNEKNGVSIEAGTKSNVIGVTKNVISGNKGNGVLITGVGTDKNEVMNSNIGINALGNIVLPNTNGVVIQDGAKLNEIGRIANTNNISGNSGAGVLISGEGTEENVLRSNNIGSAGLGNMNGVVIENNAKLNKVGINRIGNTISENKGKGVVITGMGSISNRIVANRIFNNTNIGIDLGNNGVTLNDEDESGATPHDIDDGPNRLQNFPFIISAKFLDGVTTITGTLKSTPNTIFTLEFFNNTNCDPTGFGEGEKVLGIGEVETDGTGNGEFTIELRGAIAGELITSTATDPNDNTSEFSECREVASGGPLPPGSVDLELNKQVDKTQISLGEQLIFTIKLTNKGPNAATNIAVKDLAPTGLTFTQATPGVGSYNATTGIWSINTLNAGIEATLTINASATQIGNITNTAEVIASDQLDVDSAPNNNEPDEDDQSSVTIEVQEAIVAADLELTKVVDKTQLTVGEQLTYTVTITNKGPDAATNVAVKDLFPAGTTFNQVTLSQGSFDVNTGVWVVGSLSSGWNATLTISATTTQAGTIVNTAEVTASDQQDPDSDPNNGVATEDDQSSVSIVVQDVVAGPADQIEQLMGKVNALVASGKLSSKEVKKPLKDLENALNQVNKGHNKQAIHKLESLIIEVQQLVKKGSLSSADGQELIDDAQQIIQELQTQLQKASQVNNAITSKDHSIEQQNAGFQLYGNAPNPFSTVTRISFEVTKQSKVQLMVYDQSAKLIATLLDEVVAPGLHSIEWQPNNLPAGIYILYLKSGSSSKGHRMVYVR